MKKSKGAREDALYYGAYEKNSEGKRKEHYVGDGGFGKRCDSRHQPAAYQ